MDCLRRKVQRQAIRETASAGGSAHLSDTRRRHL